MSSPNTFSGTITGGIQDISALLPLLGTEQCEKHVGSALDRGFLYSTVTPISIFGSLGIVRAAFNILVVSLNNTHFQFLGARLLSNGGFNPSGTVAPMIALDPKYPKRFLAETRLEEMLSEEHIDHVNNLTVSLGKDALRWNITLILSTLLISSIGLVPYLSIILERGHIESFAHGFGFPILRVFGSAICVTVPQVLIQIRILILLKTRLLMMSVNRLAKETGIENLASTINAKDGWASELAAEGCLWALDKWLASGPDKEQGDESYDKIKKLYEPSLKQHLGPEYAVASHWITPLLFLLAVACIATVAGYIGCFFAIQHSQSPHGPLLWLVLEVVLSVLRILIWAVNPSWDDSEGITFEIHLSNHPPMITCNRFVSEILQDKISTPVQRRDAFLEEVVAYTGPLPVLSIQDVELYYIVAATPSAVKLTEMDLNDLSTNLVTGAIFTTYEAVENATNSKCLLIIIYAHKEQTSRVLVKEAVDDSFSIYACSLHPAPGSSVINVHVEGTTKAKTHFVTSNPVFMAELEAHYDNIISRLRKPRDLQTLSRKASFGKTWAMQPSLAQPTGNDDNNPPHQTTENWPLTTGEIAYINQGVAEQRRHHASRRVGKWIDDNVGIYANALQTTPWFTPNQALGREDEVSRLRQFEAIEKEYLVCEYQTFFELFLMTFTMKWDKDIRTYHANMVKGVLMPLAQVDSQHSDSVRKKKLEISLTNELEMFLELEAVNRRNSIQNRIAASRTTLVTIEGFSDPLISAIDQRWDILLRLLSDTPDSPFWNANSEVESKLQEHPALRFYLVGRNDTESNNRTRHQDLQTQIIDRFSQFPDVPSISQIDGKVKEDMLRKVVGSLQVLYNLSTFRSNNGEYPSRYELINLDITSTWFYGVELEQLLERYNKWRETMPLVRQSEYYNGHGIHNTAHSD